MLRDNNNAINIQLASETVLSTLSEDNIHEGQISFTHGFVPHQPPKESLPEKYRAWDELQKKLPLVLAQGAEREELAKLPLLTADNPGELPNEYLARAASILGNLAHAYYFNQRHGATQSQDPLPDAIRIPWEQVNARIGRRFEKGDNAELKASRNCYDIFIGNFKVTNPSVVIDGKNNLSIQGSDLELINKASGTQAERGNNITFILAELRFAVALKYMIQAVKAVAEKDDASAIDAFKNIARVIEKVTEALDYLTPNEHSEHYVDQVVWTKSVATFDGQIPGGHAGLSGSEFPLFQTLDVFFERGHFNTPFGKAFAKKFDTLPSNIGNFLSALQQDLKQHSLRDYVETSNNPLMKNAYESMLDTFLSLMSLHRLKAYGYMQINFLNGRPVTNGGNTGERKIYDSLALADTERLGNFMHEPHYATKISVRLFGDKASEVTLDVSQSGIHFSPGDRCSVLPQNSAQAINAILKQHQWHADQEIKLNENWKRFFLTEVGVKVDTITLFEFLKYVDLNQLKIDNQEFDANQQHPISPRLYSMATTDKEGLIRLTVGRHFYDRDGSHFEGVASGYLIHGESKICIKKSTARHFHLPENPQTPILMFAAGTGIAPFMGFIDKRKMDASSGLNWLFFGTQNHEEAFYYGDELKAAEGKHLKLSVIFSRDSACDTLDRDSQTGNFELTKKYNGKHIDELIRANAKEIAKLILEQGAHVYVCGSSGFADTVREAIQIALKENANQLSPYYIESMVADLRYKIDIFAQYHEDDYQKIYRSEIAYHNKANDCWAIINKQDAKGNIIERNVYNLTMFMHIHPGGLKVLQVSAGLDMTGDYVYIGHNNDQQVNALLAQYKIGKLEIPSFSDPTIEQNYNTIIELLTALTKIENTLSVSSKLFTENPPPYIWRKTLLGLFDKENGPFKTALGPLLDAVCMMTNFAKPDLSELFKKTSECALFLRNETTGSKTPEELKKLLCLYEMLVAKTLELIDLIKSSIIQAAKEFEINSSSFEQLQFQLNAHLQKIGKNIEEYEKTITHIHDMVGLRNASKKVTFYDNSMAVCMFARKNPTSNPIAENASSMESTIQPSEAIAQQVPPAPSQEIEKKENGSWCNMFKRAIPLVVVGAAVVTTYVSQLTK